MVGQLGTETDVRVAIVNQLILCVQSGNFGAVSAANILVRSILAMGITGDICIRFVLSFMRRCLYQYLTMLLLTKGSDLISLYLTDTAGNGATDVALQYGKQYLVIMLVGLVSVCSEPGICHQYKKKQDRHSCSDAGKFCGGGNQCSAGLSVDFCVGPFPELGDRGGTCHCGLPGMWEAVIVVFWAL